MVKTFKNLSLIVINHFKKKFIPKIDEKQDFYVLKKKQDKEGHKKGQKAGKIGKVPSDL